MKTANVTIEITNEELFNELVIDVDTTGLTKNENSFNGSISIEKEDGDGLITTTGDFGSNDYKEELGFVIVSE